MQYIQENIFGSNSKMCLAAIYFSSINTWECVSHQMPTRVCYRVPLIKKVAMYVCVLLSS